MGNSVLVTIVYDSEWIEILSKLRFNVTYLAGLADLRERAQSVFPNVIYENVSDFLSGIEETGDLKESSEISALPFVPIDSKLLQDLSSHEFIIKYMINREYDHGHDRTNEIYFNLISYWLKVITHTNPSLIIVPYTPYTAREYVLYALSQVLNIPFVSFYRATVGYYLNIPFTDTTGNGFPEVIEKYKELKSIQHPFWIQDYANQRMKKKSNPESVTLLADLDLRLKDTVEFNTWRIIRNYFKNTSTSISGLSLVPSVKKIWFDIKNLPAMLNRVQPFQNLKWQYDNLCVDPDYTKPYIFFPLHYQPEQTTSPFGGYSVYQYLPIELLASCLPKGWLIYVKEHYVTFSPFHGGIKKRDRAYYERLMKIPNVRLIRSEVPSSKLIDCSRAVATITGSPGYESILRGKPAIVFGSAWYNGCEGVFPVVTTEDCKWALDAIKSGVEINPVHFLLFVQATESVGAKVNFSFSMKGIGDPAISREETVTNMVALISRWCAARNIMIQ